MEMISLNLKILFSVLNDDRIVDYRSIFSLNQVHMISDVNPNHDVDNIVHNNVLYYMPNMFQSPFDHNANNAE
jgi:hypothetical protein